MQKLWKLVSSPRHLLVFEAAARTGSFTKAAQELNVQQPAVSASIKQLETSLGIHLFDRAHRSVTLTQAGERLFNEVSSAFSRIHQTAEVLSARSEQAHVTLSASTAFAHYWMVPRLAKFHQAQPDIDLRLQTSEREPSIGSDGISLAIRRGHGDWPGCDSHLIAPEVIMPIAAPRVSAAAINLKTVANLLNETLIHLEEPIRARPGWADFFAHWNVPYAEPKVGLRLNDYALVLQAAIAGEGFAFGWQHVTEQLISQGLLVAKPEWSWETGAGFYLVWSNSEPLSPQEQAVRDWLIGL
ncbi:LysR substrate-binding domain-containing protein [Roseovarius rhodophyticola]|uniref:LysR substrate-binding domain-containing protein n=1 Tax=Roseovarius rhodophyticola TaxID=3080827 RepID=A0ABZ2TJD0_9RHOB|nr:LysR substrate-binding domain-containing protein [Roseovarius sp. W115]MDV2930137.1 LysR substrate-binding domain-containing protein [Roseovarius sp. W115]